MKISFPSYFSNNSNFKSLFLEENQFVDYTHNLDYIENVQLSINQTFLVYVCSGQVKLVSAKGIEIVNKDEAVLVTKGGYIMSEQLSSTSNNFKAFLFFLPDDLITDFCLEMDLKPVNNVSKKKVYRVNVNDSIRNYINSILLLLNSKTVNEQMTRLKAKELLHYVYNDNNTEEIQTALTQNNNLEELQIQKVVESNYCNKITIEQIAFLCGMSVSSFKRKFESFYKTTPGKWIKEKRLTLAHKLLSNTSKPISDISYEIGFESVSHFSSAFKTKYGVPPSQMNS